MLMLMPAFAATLLQLPPVMPLLSVSDQRDKPDILQINAGKLTFARSDEHPVPIILLAIARCAPSFADAPLTIAS